MGVVAAWLGRMLTGWVSQEHIRKLDLRFVAITHLYNQISCTGQVVEKLERDGERLVRAGITSAQELLRVTRD